MGPGSAVAFRRAQAAHLDHTPPESAFFDARAAHSLLGRVGVRITVGASLALRVQLSLSGDDETRVTAGAGSSGADVSDKLDSDVAVSQLRLDRNQSDFVSALFCHWLIDFAFNWTNNHSGFTGNSPATLPSLLNLSSPLH